MEEEQGKMAAKMAAHTAVTFFRCILQIRCRNYIISSALQPAFILHHKSQEL